MYFVTIIAWIAFIWYSFKSMALGYLHNQYNNTKLGQLERMLDQIKGFKKVYKLGYNPHIAVVSFAWLIYYYFN